MRNSLNRREFLSMALPFALSLPGYRYQFPRDHFAHPEFQTEWWYYTGNLRASGQRFGFQLTFFRQAQQRAAAEEIWSASTIWMAHCALSDVAGQQFHHTQRLNRSGPGLAGVDPSRGLVWNGNWQAGLSSLRVVEEAYSLELVLEPRKQPVIHGREGVSQKAAGAGRASHYISLSRIAARGKLHYRGKDLSVEGLTWMDHEFFTHQLAPEQAGWDWFSVQLQDNTELMLFRLRRKDGSADPFSAGTYIDTQGRARHLVAEDFQLVPADNWTSPSTGARYPLRWRISVPLLGLSLQATTPLRNQEVVSRSSLAPNYWEGAVDFQGTRAGKPIAGEGYLEMTGYDKPMIKF
jgi:predicted secreted hydrolase